MKNISAILQRVNMLRQEKLFLKINVMAKFYGCDIERRDIEDDIHGAGIETEIKKDGQYIGTCRVYFNKLDERGDYWLETMFKKIMERK